MTMVIERVANMETFVVAIEEDFINRVSEYESFSAFVIDMLNTRIFEPNGKGAPPNGSENEKVRSKYPNATWFRI
ncbi:MULTISPECIES: hypothetical protein [Micrococcus]|uniref:hypothetical protein n=1 Tax=Micrococcus TaxID=1269 RepID=UPI00114CE691|nr:MULTISPECIES: hypothetical protein [Micrococcus]